MPIPQDILEVHQGLSNCSGKFLDFTAKNPASLKFSNYSMLNLNDDLIRLQPWPTFINRDKKKEMQEASTRVFNLIKSIPVRIFANNTGEMGRYYETPAEEVKSQLAGVDDRHLNHLLARGDFILSRSGFKCIEFNVTANLGGLQVPFWESLYLNTPVISEFLREYDVRINKNNLLSALLEHLIDAALEKFTDFDDGMNVVIAIRGYSGKYYPMELYLNELYKKKLHSRDSKLRGKIVICDLGKLVISADHVFYEDKRIHNLIEMYHGSLPDEITAVFKAGNICIYNGPITGLLSNKLNLALLSENKDTGIFSDREREIIGKYIPWTRKITAGTFFDGREKIDMVDYIISNREKLIIKPALGYGGWGVYIGQNTMAGEWEKIVKNAAKEKKWLAQEYVQSYPYLYQAGDDGCAVCDAVWGFFVLCSEYAGSWVRVLPREKSRGVINCHQGATVSIVFETEE